MTKKYKVSELQRPYIITDIDKKQDRVEKLNKIYGCNRDTNTNELRIENSGYAGGSISKGWYETDADYRNYNYYSYNDIDWDNGESIENKLMFMGRELKVGTRVKIKNDLTGCTWQGHDDSCCKKGFIGTITNIASHLEVGFNLDGNKTWWYASDSIEHTIDDSPYNPKEDGDEYLEYCMHDYNFLPSVDQLNRWVNIKFIVSKSPKTFSVPKEDEIVFSKSKIKKSFSIPEIDKY